MISISEIEVIFILKNVNTQLQILKWQHRLGSILTHSFLTHSWVHSGKVHSLYVYYNFLIFLKLEDNVI